MTHVREWVLGYLPSKGRIRNSMIHRVLGQSIFSKDLWRPDERSVSGGLSLGLFVAFTPTIPFQMLLTALGALRLRVNLPTALAACWVTNPLTAIPIYLMTWKLGRWIVFATPWLEDLLSVQIAGGRLPGFFLDCACLWIGSLILALGAASVAGPLTRGVWRGLVRTRTKSVMRSQGRHAQMVYRDN